MLKLINKNLIIIFLMKEDSQVQKLKSFKAFHVIRDPRDIIVSGYYSHLYTHSTEGWSTLEEHRKALQDLNKDEGLLKEIEFSSYFINFLKGWNFNDERILEIKFEQLTKQPEQYIKEICRHLNIYTNKKIPLFISLLIRYINLVLRKTKLGKIPFHVSDNYINYICKKRSFKNMSKGRKKGDENTNSHYRKGESGDWKNHFKQEHIDKFKELYPNLIENLGYEPF